VPVPKKFDRRPPERDLTRINERIRVPEVRLIDEDGNQVGVIKTDEALAYAQERDLDLVEVAPEARPPVCRVLDYSKYKYEQAQKQKAARKHQQQITIREIKFRPKIAQNDYDTKKGHVRRFLTGKDKVKITIMFRGREVTHPERGMSLLDRLADELSDVGVVEQSPLQDGRNMTMMLAPSRAVLADHQDDSHDGRHDGAGAEHNGAPAKAGQPAPPEAEQPANAEVEAEQPAEAEVEAEKPAEAEVEAEQPAEAEVEAEQPAKAEKPARKAQKQPSGASRDAAA
jgi:translation initiation factor IF-3